MLQKSYLVLQRKRLKVDNEYNHIGLNIDFFTKYDELDEGIIEQKQKLHKTQRTFFFVDLTIAVVISTSSILAVALDLNSTVF